MPACKACECDRKLIQAHVIPKAWSPKIDEHGRPPKIISDNSFPKRSPSGIYDTDIVCVSCEGVFSCLDDYATKFLLNGKRETVLRSAYVYQDVNREIILKFVASLILRASWSSHDAYRRVNIGSYVAKLREFIFADGIVPEIDVIISEYDQESIPWFGPYQIRMDQARFWVVSAARFVFWIKLDKRKTPSEFQDISLCTCDKVISVIREWDRSKQKESMVDLARKAQAKFGRPWNYGA